MEHGVEIFVYLLLFSFIEPCFLFLPLFGKEARAPSRSLGKERRPDLVGESGGNRAYRTNGTSSSCKESNNFLSYQSIRINQEHPKNEILTEVQFSDRAEVLRNKTKKAKEILPFVNTFNPATPNLKKILMKH